MRRILVANRGEIALRIVRAACDLGIETVAVYTEADRNSLHISTATRAICIGAGAAATSYLDPGILIHAACATNCDALHPGYGFLSESADFARQCTEAGLIFIGPTVENIEAMGDKAEARQVAETAHVPVVPGMEWPIAEEEDESRLVGIVGLPALLKARAGGGGKGMRRVDHAEELDTQAAVASVEAEAAFGDGRLYAERYLARVRHIEVQVLADQYGDVVQLGERDCSLQRRHQKVLEECPSPVIPDELRQAMGYDSIRIAKAVDYVGAGTLEFLLDLDTGKYFFIEMNTRIQVEHPLTELISDVDLVAWQILIAGGEHLTITQSDITFRGHALECRINAEDPQRGFRPTPGTIRDWHPPSGPGVRLDSHCKIGSVVSPYYDSLVAKVIVSGADRNEAIRRARRAISEFHIAGISTTIPLHRWILDHPAFIEGTCTTTFLDREWRSAPALAADGEEGES